jgi:hypothetical protein
MRYFGARFRIDSATCVIDVGGYSDNWSLLAAEPLVVLANTDRAEWDDRNLSRRFIKVEADGRRLPFCDNAFDVVYSNSVIEHVGDAKDQAAFAGEVRRVATRYFVQTPNRRFPIEPHLIAPLIHFLPKGLQRKLVRWCSVWGWMQRPDQAEIEAMLGGTRLLSRTEMAALFPEAEIVVERFIGLPKSLIAVNGAPLTTLSNSKGTRMFRNKLGGHFS